MKLTSDELRELAAQFLSWANEMDTIADVVQLRIVKDE